jgi:tetratricopeptide (TPR) repeat protein
VAVTVVLLAGLGVSLYQMQRALSAEALARKHAAEAVAERDAKAKALQAEEQARLLAEQKRQEAETNLGYARKANEILGSVFTGLDPRAEYETIAEFRNALASNLKQAVEQLEGSAIGDPLVVAEMQNTLGLSLLGLGETHLAITLFERALTTRKAQLGPEHPDTLTSMNNLASAYMDDGRLDDALRLRKETLELFKARLGPEHPDTLISMNNLASAYQDAGRLDEALPLYEQTLELRKARLGTEHPDTLSSMNNLASAYMDAGRLDEAIKLLEETVELRKAQLGLEHADTLSSMNNLALAYRAAGRLNEALTLCQQTLQLLKARLGPEHPVTLQSMNNLAGAYQAAGRLDEALPLFEQAATGMAKRGFRHKYAAHIVQNTINAYEVARQFNKAEAWRRTWAAHVKEVAGGDSLPYAGELAGLGLNLLQQHKYSEAEAVLRECLSIRKTQQPEDWTTFSIQSVLGEALLGQEKYGDAEPLLRAAYEGLKARQKDIPQPWRVQLLVEAVDRLIALYTAVNRPDDVQTWQAEKERLTAPKD